jgi:hypothetical protein
MKDRGQTTLDFATGISVFLVAAVFVFGFVPGLLQPFNQGAQEETVVGDRIASQLAEGSLADPGEPYVLDTDCTIDFFQVPQSNNPEPDCAFGQSGGSVTERLGVTSRQRVNVTVEGDTNGGPDELLCWDQDDDKIVEQSDTECGSGKDQRLGIGPVPPETSSSVVTSRRAVTIAGNDAEIVVRVW